MKTYEGLFILDIAGREDSEKDIVDRIQKAIENAGGRVETVQRMGTRPFARTSKARTAGYYVNFIFEAPPKAIAELDAKFPMEADVFRWQITEPMPEMPEREPRMKAEAEAKAVRE